MKIKTYIICLSILIGFVWSFDLPAQIQGWERMADMPEATGWYGSCIDPIGEKAYIFGGSHASGGSQILSKTTQIYDFKTDEWSFGAEMPSAASAFRAEMVNGKIYINGEYSQPLAMTTVKVYDPDSNTWTQNGLSPEIFLAHGSCVYNGLIYLFGGRRDNPNPINTVRTYDPLTDTWDTLSDMPDSRMKSAVCIYEDEIYLFGGNPSLKYTPSTDSWNELNTGECKIDGYAVPIMDGDRILLFGGYKFGGTYPNPIDEVWAYYPATDTLVEFDVKMPFSRFCDGYKYNNFVYLFGGHFANSLGSVTNEVWRFNLDNVAIEENEYTSVRSSILYQNYPNPVNTTTHIEYEVKEPGWAQIIIYNHLGTQVEIIIEKYHQQGKHQLTWRPENLPAGIYFCVLKTKSQVQTIKMLKP